MSLKIDKNFKTTTSHFVRFFKVKKKNWEFKFVGTITKSKILYSKVVYSKQNNLCVELEAKLINTPPLHSPKPTTPYNLLPTLTSNLSWKLKYISSYYYMILAIVFKNKIRKMKMLKLENGNLLKIQPTLNSEYIYIYTQTKRNLPPTESPHNISLSW